MKVRTIKNRHGSAQAALDAWLAGSLWGNPIQMGPDKFHVYGCTRSHGRLKYRRWRTVSVEFETKRITVMHDVRVR